MAGKRTGLDTRTGSGKGRGVMEKYALSRRRRRRGTLMGLN